ncbi:MULTISPECIES: cupin domain-containing protein [Natrialbaceae]|uniref:cupin domain-containing protein n=1 Tax=Natrialbaceae TaxID=1644061 RepID=UPI00207D09C5|nr:cupin domain-containing protein [Natronococcus sp. CG52]
MERVSIDDLESEPYDEAYQSDRRVLSDALNTAHLAVTRYALEPGERFSGSVHAHADQEEVFVVLEGEATFETRAGEVAVEEDEVIRFAPGEFQSGRNAADETLVALALGAPRETDDIRIDRIPVLDDRNVSCPECERDSMRIPTDGRSGLVCQVCDATLEVE